MNVLVTKGLGVEQLVGKIVAHLLGENVGEFLRHLQIEAGLGVLAGDFERKGLSGGGC